MLFRSAALGRELELELPKGAGAAANETAVRLVERHGVEALRRASKLHFRNARVLDRSVAEKRDEAAGERGTG